MSKTAVIILNWNGKRYLEQFLPGVVMHSGKDAEVYVADNASTDDSVEYLKRNFPSVKVICSDKNRGFAGGYNQAIKEIDADYYVLLNSDVEVTPNWIKPVIQQMESSVLIAACQPKIKDYNRRTFFEYAGAAGGMIDQFGYPFCRGRIFDTIEEDKGQYEHPTEIFWASGACLFIRSDIFNSFGGFDEDFFAHMEEIDLCWRIKNAGFKIMYCPSSTIYHVGGGTLHKSNPHKTFLNFRNNLFMLYKNLSDNSLFRVIYLRICLDGLAGFKFLFSLQLKNVIAIVDAHWAFYKKLPFLREKRTLLKQKVVHPNKTGIYNGMIVIDYFFRKRKTFQQL